MVLLEEGKEPLGREKVRFLEKIGLPQGVKGASWWEKVGSSGRVVSPGELSEPLNGDKVVSLKRVVSPGETLQPRMMMCGRG